MSVDDVPFAVKNILNTTDFLNLIGTCLYYLPTIF